MLQKTKPMLQQTQRLYYKKANAMLQTFKSYVTKQQQLCHREADIMLQQKNKGYV